MTVKYKNLKRVAQDFEDWFTAMVDEDSGEPVMSHLARCALDTGSSELTVDLFSGIASPRELMVRAVKRSVALSVGYFPEAVAKRSFPIEKIKSARMKLLFEPARLEQDGDSSDHKEIPCEAWVTIVDDRGTTHVAHSRHLWRFRAHFPRLRKRRGVGQFFRNLFGKRRKTS